MEANIYASSSPTGSLRSLKTSSTLQDQQSQQQLHENLRRSAEVGRMLLTRCQSLQEELSMCQSEITDKDKLILEKDHLLVEYENELENYKRKMLLMDEALEEGENNFAMLTESYKVLKSEHNIKKDDILRLKLDLSASEERNFDLEKQIRNEISWRDHSKNFDDTGFSSNSQGPSAAAAAANMKNLKKRRNSDSEIAEINFYSTKIIEQRLKASVQNKNTTSKSPVFSNARRKFELNNVINHCSSELDEKDNMINSLLSQLQLKIHELEQANINKDEMESQLKMKIEQDRNNRAQILEAESLMMHGQVQREHEFGQLRSNNSLAALDARHRDVGVDIENVSSVGSASDATGRSLSAIEADLEQDLGNSNANGTQTLTSTPIKARPSKSSSKEKVAQKSSTSSASSIASSIQSAVSQTSSSSKKTSSKSTSKSDKGQSQENDLTSYFKNKKREKSKAKIRRNKENREALENKVKERNATLASSSNNKYSALASDSTSTSTWSTRTTSNTSAKSSQKNSNLPSITIPQSSSKLQSAENPVSQTPRAGPHPTFTRSKTKDKLSEMPGGGLGKRSKTKDKLRTRQKEKSKDVIDLTDFRRLHSPTQPLPLNMRKPRDFYSSDSRLPINHFSRSSRSKTFTDLKKGELKHSGMTVAFNARNRQIKGIISRPDERNFDGDRLREKHNKHKNDVRALQEIHRQRIEKEKARKENYNVLSNKFEKIIQSIVLGLG